MEEKMTVEDAWLLSVFSAMKETRNDRLLQCAFGIGYGKWMGKRESFSTVQIGESPRWWVEFDGKYHSEGPAFIQSILDRVGDHDIENRAQAVIHNATVEFWGGEEEYQKTWGWMKNHSDLESVDNTCIECGAVDWPHMSIPVGHAGQLGSKATRVESPVDLPCCGEYETGRVVGRQPAWIKNRAKNLFAI